jgi:hypothetical protein
MPSISAMTITGSGPANASIRSKPSALVSGSSSSPMIRRMRGARRSTARGVNALLTSARSRVWSGGSLKSMLAAWPGGQKQAHVRALVRLVRIEGHRAVPEHALDVVVAREDPAVDLRVIVRWLVPAQACQHGMGVRPKRRVERRELGAGRNAFPFDVGRLVAHGIASAHATRAATRAIRSKGVGSCSEL